MTTFRAKLLDGHAYTTMISAGKHALLVDKSPESGGEDYGPSPWDLFILSLASCAVVTMLAFARHRNLDVRDIAVDVTHERVKTAEHPEGIDVFRKSITVQGNLTGEEKDRLLEVSRHCPVQRTVTSHTAVIEEMMIVTA